MGRAGPNDQGDGGFAIHTIRSDATNGRIWHRSKLHVTEVDSIYSVSSADDVVQTTILGDLLLVKSGSTELCRSMIEKQCLSLGMPLWLSVVEKVMIHPAIGEDHVQLLLYDELCRQKKALLLSKRPLAITVYIQVTDAGSEQVACRKTVHEDVRLCLTVLHFSGNCLQHQQHLGFKRTFRVSEFILLFLPFLSFLHRFLDSYLDSFL